MGLRVRPVGLSGAAGRRRGGGRLLPWLQGVKRGSGVLCWEQWVLVWDRSVRLHASSGEAWGAASSQTASVGSGCLEPLWR